MPRRSGGLPGQPLLHPQALLKRNLAVQQIVSRAVVSTEFVDILQAAGVEAPDISILSDEFLAEVQGLEKKNFAMEALCKLVNSEIRSPGRGNFIA